MKKPIETEPEPEIKITPLSGKINPIKNCSVQLTGQNLESHRVKRIKTRILNFEGLENPEHNTLQKLAFNLKGHRNLQKLSMKWPNKEKGLEKLPFILHKLRSLNDLSLDLNSYDMLRDCEFVHLKRSFRSLCFLEGLSLDFSKQQEFGEYIKPLKLESAFKKLRSLKRISLDFNRPWEDSDMKLLQESFDRLTMLKEISLNFHCNSFAIETDAGIASVKKLLQKHLSLEKFHLKFRGCLGISDVDLNDLRDGLLEQTSLKHISLIFAMANKITDVGVGYLKEAFKRMTALESISLDFSLCDRITETGLSYLKESFQACQALQNISVSFQNCGIGPKITNSSLIHLKDGLAKLPHLKHLSLDFRDCKKVTNAGVGHLKDCLLGFRSLQRLFLQFHGCKQITDNGILALKEGLEASTSLQHLSLSFSGDNITDKGVTYLRDGIKTLTSLKHFSLQIRESKKITDNAIKSLEEALQPTLESLYLDFFQCSKLTDQALNYLKKCFLKMTSLQYLFLNFYKTKITDDGFGDLKEGLKRLTSLKDFSINIYECEITDYGLDHLKEGLLALPCLRFLYFQHSQELETSFRRKNQLETVKKAGMKDFEQVICKLPSMQNMIVEKESDSERMVLRNFHDMFSFLASWEW